MDGAKVTKVEIKGQPFHPLDQIRNLLLISLERLKGFGDLPRVVVAVASQISSLLVLGVVGNEVQLVVAYDREGLPRVHEAANEMQDTPALRASINEIAEEEELTAFGMDHSPALIPVAKLFQEALQSTEFAVDVADEVVVLY